MIATKFSFDQLRSIGKNYSTPLIVYKEEIIENRIKILQRTLSQYLTKNPFVIKYAMKANSNIKLLELIKSYQIHHIDTVSVNECHIAKLSGYLSQNITFTPNCVNFEEIEQIFSMDIGILIIDDMNLLESIMKKYDKINSKNSKIKFGIRINPSLPFDDITSNRKIHTSYRQCKFGILFDQFEKLEKLFEKYSNNLYLSGIHFHLGSELTNASKSINSVIQQVMEWKNGIEKMQKRPIEFIDIGGGINVAYENDEIDVIYRNMVETFKLIDKKLSNFPHLEIHIEPGKWIISESAVLLTTVQTVKEDNRLIGVNTGFNHIIRPMFYGSYHRIDNIECQSSVDEFERYSIVGCICETDTIRKEWNGSAKINDIEKL